MPTIVEWYKIARDFCSPTRPDFLQAWRELGADLGGLTTHQIRERLSPYPYGVQETCPAAIAKHLRWAVATVGPVPPEDWPKGYAKPGNAQPAEPKPAPVAGQPPKVERVANPDGSLTVNAKGQHLIQNIDQLIEYAEIDLATWRVERHKVNTWTTPIKGNDGSPRVVRNWQVSATLVRRLDAPVAGRSPVVVGTPAPRVAKPWRPQECAVIVPDSQHGYVWSEDRRRLIALHDERACDVVSQIIGMVQPEHVVYLGDMLDLAEWSTRFPRPAEHRDTTQPTLNRLHHWIAEHRASSPGSAFRYMEGNHEARINRALVETMTHAAGIRAVNDDRAALDVARLLDLDSLGIEYVGPYGESFYLWDDARLTHGDKVRAGGGATAVAVCKEATHTTLYGHVHRVESASKTLHGPKGRKVVTAASPGCLCRVDGAVPGVSARPDWQQGVAVLWWDGEHAHVELVQIIDGRAVWRGDLIEGEDRSAEIGAAIGWPMIGA